MPFVLILLLSSLITLTSEASAQLCRSWSSTEHVFDLANPPFAEVSGMVASQNFPGRVYLVNDSGDHGHFYVLDLTSGRYQKVEVEGFPGYDIEAITLGPCGRQTCLFIADIGDNELRRKIVRIAAVVEKEAFGRKASALRHKKLSYPDGAHDAEALFATTTGELFILSKEFGYFSSDPTRIYRTDYATLAEPGVSEVQYLGKFRLYNPGFLASTPLLTVTDASLSADESRMLLMTYTQAFEIRFGDFLSRLQSGEQEWTLPYLTISTGFAVQNESVAYLDSEEGFIWTNEAGSSPAPLYFRACEERE